MNSAPRSVRPHIALLGRCNVGKSTLINALCGQNIALVSPVSGTTTDPVYKSMELLPFGPVVLVDTAGLDDNSILGRARIKLTARALRKAELALLVVDSIPLLPIEQETLTDLCRRQIPYLVVFNSRDSDIDELPQDISLVNAHSGLGIPALKETIAAKLAAVVVEPPLISDRLRGDGAVILVVPIDKAAPKGRLILPQMQVLRDILDAGHQALVCRETELHLALKTLSGRPQLVITDSQVFQMVVETIPSDVPLTSFSIIMARHKGSLPALSAATAVLAGIKAHDKILIAEACTHHSQDEDIGRIKIPSILRRQAGGELDFTWVSGQEFPDELDYKLIVHCGACMITRKEMLSRSAQASEAGIPMINYGLLLAYYSGILERSLQPFRQNT
ncbi:MAG: GTPase Der [Firmicutes bacterium]|nr:GTPase Der [Bacillota bacterium]